MTWLLRYWKALAAVLLGVLLWGWGYATARTVGQLALAQQLNAQAAAYRKQAERWQAQAIAADDALRKAQAALPKTGQRVADAIRANPTSPDCRVPDAVVSGLQDGIDASKAHTSG